MSKLYLYKVDDICQFKDEFDEVIAEAHNTQQIHDRSQAFWHEGYTVYDRRVLAFPENAMTVGQLKRLLTDYFEDDDLVVICKASEGSDNEGFHTLKQLSTGQVEPETRIPMKSTAIHDVRRCNNPQEEEKAKQDGCLKQAAILLG